MKFKSILFLFSLVTALALSSCSDSESYADLLNDERRATNAYLANCRVVNEVPSDTVFEFGKYAPYYLNYWYKYGEMIGEGNENNMNAAPTYFQYGNYTLNTSAQWGYGIQMPLTFLGVDSEVNLIIKSKLGWASEISAVIPFLYHVRYFRNQI